MEIARWATIVQSRLCQYNAHGGRSREKLIICILHKKMQKSYLNPCPAIDFMTQITATNDKQYSYI